LNPTYQDDYNAAIQGVSHLLSTRTPAEKGKPWRFEGFRTPEGGAVFGPGVLTFSPGWFMMARDVSRADISKPNLSDIARSNSVNSCTHLLACSVTTLSNTWSELHMQNGSAMP